MRMDEVGIALFVDRFRHSSERMKSLFIALDEGFNVLGATPTRMGAGRSDVKGTGNYATYRGLKPRLMKSNFSTVEHFSLDCLPEGRRKDYISFVAYATASREWSGGIASVPIRWTCDWVVFPEDAKQSEDAVIASMMRIADLVMDEYGYMAWMRRGAAPFEYDSDVGFGYADRFRNKEEAWNRFTWPRLGTWTRRLLRDTFPINFLDRTYLDRPIEGKTLGEWILADPLRRGTLEPFNARVWVWKPVVRWIPFIREPLFRAGLLHWWGFFAMPGIVGQEAYESVKECAVEDFAAVEAGAPLRIPNETPSMFRPEWYEGRDPKITN